MYKHPRISYANLMELADYYVVSACNARVAILMEPSSFMVDKHVHHSKFCV